MTQDISRALRPFYERMVDYLDSRRRQHKAAIGIGGGPAVGKSFLARDLLQYLRTTRRDAEVLSTDDFLMSRQTLAERGLHKSYPEAVEHDRMRATLTALRSGADEVVVPVYDRQLKDRATTERKLSGRRTDFFILEGLTALSTDQACAGIGHCLDLAIYIDAAEPDMRSWWLARAAHEASIGAVGSRSPGEALQKWEHDCLREFRDWVLPTRRNADAVIVKDAVDGIRGIGYHHRLRRSPELADGDT